MDDFSQATDKFDLFTNGTGTIYETVIQSLRSFLNSIEHLNKTEGGAIIFFTQKDNSDNLRLKIFPFNTNSILFKNIPLTLQEKVKLFALINKSNLINSYRTTNLSGITMRPSDIFLQGLLRVTS